MLSRIAQVSLLVGAISVSAVTAAAQAPEQTATVSGKDVFDNYCAVCHGSSGKGDGPLGQELKTTPTDLRTIAKKNGGVFPAERVFKLIEGKDPSVRGMRSHGRSDMPVWGDVFTKVRDFVPVKDKIDALVRHIARMQTQ